MPPIVKDSDTTASTLNNPAASPAARSSHHDVSARPQPVALEIPVTVNGARTVDGSDKREPFSESSKTVLVFSHGAVIRLATPVSAGQLLFVTNEKSKKEVVCQVVKSKNYSTVTGYVELEFTEPAAGFWGMRFPAAAAPPAPSAAPRVAPPPVAAKPPIAAPPVQPPAPSVVKPEPPKPVVEAAAPVAKPEPPKPVIEAAAPIVAPPAPVAPIAPVAPVAPVAPAAPVAIVAPPAPAPQVVPVELPAPVAALPPAPEPPKSEPVPAPVAAAPSTTELQQQAAHLQEQLSSMLFSEAPAPVAPSPAQPPAAPVSDVASQLFELAKPEPPKPVVAAPESSVTAPKPFVAPSKPLPSSLDAEEVQIPAWLAPLAQEDKSSPVIEPEERAVSEIFASSSDASGSASSEDPAMFGGQLLGSSASSDASASSGSRTGLFVGIAAVVALLLGGGFWYLRQPASAPNSAVVSASAATVQPQTSASTTAPATSSPAAATPASAASTSPASRSAQPPAAQPQVAAPVSAAPPADDSRAAAARAHESQPAPEERKPLIGDVKLAAPTVNRAADTSAPSDAAPSLDGSQPVANRAALAALDPNSSAPKAPIPVGGDALPAHLVKSVPPVYPPSARSQRIQGNVTLDAQLDAAGNVTAVKVISGSPLLHDAAMTAVKQWKYAPALLNGTPTASHLTVVVQFHLQ